MLRIIHSRPDRCPNCGSSKIGEVVAVEMGEDSLICHDCGIFMVFSDENREDSLENPEVVAEILSCPHCRSSVNIEEAGGEEWCSNCGLDPNTTDYPSSELSYLWKSGSDIQNLMDKDIKITQVNRRVGDFLRSSCGPHCDYAKDCPQSIKNLMKCLDEEKEVSADYDMGKGKKKKKLNWRKPTIGPVKESNPPKSLFLCASAGWFEERMYDKTKNSEPSGTTGSRSRT